MTPLLVSYTNENSGEACPVMPCVSCRLTPLLVAVVGQRGKARGISKSLQEVRPEVVL